MINLVLPAFGGHDQPNWSVRQTLQSRYEDIRGHALSILAIGAGLVVISIFAGTTVSEYFFGFLPVILGVTPIYMVNTVRCPDCRHRVLKGRLPLVAPEFCPRCGARPGEIIMPKQSSIGSGRKA